MNSDGTSQIYLGVIIKGFCGFNRANQSFEAINDFEDFGKLFLKARIIVIQECNKPEASYLPKIMTTALSV